MTITRTNKLLIMQYIRYQPKTDIQNHNKHYYSIPMLNLRSISRFVTFDNPCITCGKPRENSIHNLAGTELARA